MCFTVKVTVSSTPFIAVEVVSVPSSWCVCVSNVVHVVLVELLEDGGVDTVLLELIVELVNKLVDDVEGLGVEEVAVLVVDKVDEVLNVLVETVLVVVDIVLVVVEEEHGSTSQNWEKPEVVLGKLMLEA